MPSFSSSLEKSIHSALKLANERNHELATLEHLLLALLDEKDASNVLLACDVNVNELRTNIENFLGFNICVLIGFSFGLSNQIGLLGSSIYIPFIY